MCDMYKYIPDFENLRKNKNAKYLINNWILIVCQNNQSLDILGSIKCIINFIYFTF